LGAPGRKLDAPPPEEGGPLNLTELLKGPHARPVLPVRQTVLFPYAFLPLNISRERNVALVKEVMTGDRLIVVVAQRDAQVEDPHPVDLHEVGTLGIIVRMLRLPEGGTHVLVQGLARVRIAEVLQRDPYFKAKVVPLEEREESDVETQALMKTVLEQVERVVSMVPQMPNEVVQAAHAVESPSRLADFLASLLDIPTEDKQALLQELDVKSRLKALTAVLARELQVMEVGKKIQEDVKEALDERQKEFLLRQQLEAIQKQLGEGDEGRREIQDLKAKLDKAQLPPEVRKEADRELGRLARIPQQSPEYTVIRTYLEWIGDMPWAVATEDNLDLKHARTILDEDHYGLDKVKERMLEYLAVRHFKRDARTPILCFVGPPGTGKTSLGRSIARALGRRFVRQSLGGVRDEAEIRGHRRTYIGALPGNIIQGIRRAASNNPVFMLDEVDKLGADFRGDPGSALLEVLDPEQNVAFVDHYLDVPFNLSSVLFICTANYLDPVPPALRDRLEVIELTGYTESEKLAIARRHLMPKAIRENGLEELGLSVTDDGVLKVVREYTSEAGLRNLERELANLLRKTAKAIAEGHDPPHAINEARVRELLGPERFTHDQAQALDEPGAALGLAWTPVGGEVLTVEATAMPGKKDLLLTGQLGDVMKESAVAALSYIRSHAPDLGIDPNLFENIDIHVHLPAGAIPKDGPSAGITLCTALVSLLTGRKVRPGIAMTGEITLRGRVLAVGGIKEKVLAANRAGLNTVILPRENEKDLEDVPLEVRTRTIFAPVDRIEQVLDLALEPAPVAGEEGAEVTGEDGGQAEGKAEPTVGEGPAADSSEERAAPPSALPETPLPKAADRAR
jgi:ATP-dependent Lon protease